ncbi:hypothetical protein [Lysobacter gummosus]
MLARPVGQALIAFFHVARDRSGAPPRRARAAALRTIPTAA